MHITYADNNAQSTSSSFGPSGEVIYGQDGMTIRETMAMHICAGLAANHDYAINTIQQIANCSVEQADALIEALNKEPAK